jgi:hypothetical protein
VGHFVTGGFAAPASNDGVDERDGRAGDCSGVGCDDEQGGVGFVEHGGVKRLDVDLLDGVERISSGAEP